MEQTGRTRETEWVVQELARGANRNDIVMQLCQARGWSWQEADQFVAVTEESQHHRIAARQSPLLVVLGLGTVIVGIVLLAYALYEMVVAHYFSRSTIAALITGLGMVPGGLWGTWRAITAVFRDY